MDYDGFHSLNDQLCRNNRCNGDKELDATGAARPSSTGNQEAMLTFTSNTQDPIARILNRDVHSVEAELASMLYHVEDDDNDTDTEGR